MTIHRGVGKTNFTFILTQLSTSYRFSFLLLFPKRSGTPIPDSDFLFQAFAHTVRLIITMPPIRTARNRKPPPAGFDDIEDTLLEFSNKMKDAENAPHEGKKKHEVLWPIFQISHQRSRYIYDLYYEKEAISKQLYDWLLKNKYADANLIAKWKKQGYEKLCCLRCVQTKETNFNSTCICRVPKAQLKEEQTIQCVACGCRGCSSSD
ncbi:hypothetical protein N7454_000322 [Penicillium verhagenii]|nr:hypothetical protein N7454_000322 [Penicillium verhagenii]